MSVRLPERAVEPGEVLDPRAIGLIVAATISVVLLCVLSIVPMPVALMRPGPVADVLAEVDDQPVIKIEGRKTYPTKGSLDLLTVNVSGGPGSVATVWDLIDGALDPQTDVRPVAEVFPPNETQEQIDKDNAADMATSQEVATAAALRELNIPFSGKVAVASVGKGSGAEGKLQPGDVILRFDGRPVPDQTALRGYLEQVRPGDEVTIVVRRGAVGKTAEQTVTVRTSETTDDDGSKRTVLGVVPGLADVTFPLKVSITIEDIGGPSAGMIFALGIIDKLTPGALTGGQQIAGTGRIDYVGTVGEIGGIRQKAIAAREAGATWFLAPIGNCPDLRGHVPDGLRVVRVATLHEAHTAVQAIGARDQAAIATLPTC